MFRSEASIACVCFSCSCACVFVSCVRNCFSCSYLFMVLRGGDRLFVIQDTEIRVVGIQVKLS